MGLSLWQILGIGFGLALVIEGLMPFLSPDRWRQVVQQIQQLSNGQIRFFGLMSMVVGVILMCAFINLF